MFPPIQMNRSGRSRGVEHKEVKNLGSKDPSYMGRRAVSFACLDFGPGAF
jgi:hypothetical protein